MPLGYWLRIQLKKVFMGKEKKAINILQFFLFPIKVMSKFSLIGFLTSALRAFVSMTQDEDHTKRTRWRPHKVEMLELSEATVTSVDKMKEKC